MPRAIQGRPILLATVKVAARVVAAAGEVLDIEKPTASVQAGKTKVARLYLATGALK